MTGKLAVPPRTWFGPIALRRVLAVAMILSLLALNVTATRPPAHPVAARHPLKVGLSYGDTLVWMSAPQLAAALDDAVQLGAGWVRADLSWYTIQSDGRDSYHWELFDRVVDEANKRKLNVLPVLAYTPPWARPAGCDAQACRPADPAEFAEFARAAVERYAPRGIHTWEIWNEPNLSSFWLPRPDAGAYTALLQPSAAAIRSADPSARVVLGGLASVRTGDRNIAQSDFLAQVSALGGNRVVDGIGYHPYTYPYLPSARTSFRTPWERMERGTDSMRTVLTRFGTPTMPIWVTEVGAPTDGPGTTSDGSPAGIRSSTTHVTEQRQARIAADAVRTASGDPYVAALVWYSDRDLSADRSSEANFYGLRRPDGSVKPAFAALRSAITALGSQNDRNAVR